MGGCVGGGVEEEEVVVGWEAPVAEQALPELHACDAEDDEDEDGERAHIAEHGYGVDDEGDEDAHALGDGQCGSNRLGGGF